ncbi:phenylacetate--CoA ligase family protein [Nocardia panacis]|uniref:Phenylacetate--CoA ligase family protein n=1 Tax=Nocardia panacis TaxID=2340916 RepID=A0A3A4KEQ4_9NOCA|nr:phenylacetate--CoA ligase family protein [Nocardia panacis]RJO70939.1 phenylacetate--CoA ligase family protein [Nocardia panacis]
MRYGVGLTSRERWRLIRLRAVSGALALGYGAAAVDPAIWRYMVRTFRPSLGRLAARHALLACQVAALDVPAYRSFLRRSGTRKIRRLSDFPETDKRNYAGVYDEASRCHRGELHRAGVIVDESSGSTGTPFNWVRGPRELRNIYRNAAGYVELAFPGQRRFVINAYSMGAWATGTTTGAAMARIAMVKNTGPDLDKIMDTLRHFGPDYDYIVAAYPPFLKHLRDRLDATGFPWAEYHISGMVGGESMTEALRDYLERRFARIRSGYGASDLTIGLGAETGFTVWLRRRLSEDAALRRALLGPNEQRLPMIFHYNPLETYLEVNPRGELLCTLTSPHCLQPKLRYNVGDEVMLRELPAVEAILRRDPQLWAECRRAAAGDTMRLPLLFVFGRADSTVSYMGANLYPQDIEYGLYRDNPHADRISRFCLALEELPDLESRPVVHLEIDSIGMDSDDLPILAETCRRGVLDHLARVSRDFAASLREDPAAADLRVRLHEPGAGPFAGMTKLKNSYLVQTS